MSMFTHAFVGANDMEASAKFYDAVFAPLGVKHLTTAPNGTRFYGVKSPEFAVNKPLNGETATAANGGTLGFGAPTIAAVDEFYKNALANGGTCEGPPGRRKNAPGQAYGAYVRDPVGNKICAYTMEGAVFGEGETETEKKEKGEGEQ
eukprot:TRINITY_DN6773_c0_g1_i1.p1 TRINITY_DN6773_c0_g1~~TRINITY_DN6773_c0_g1_i1.p1  ORF type:complete len:148 (-),score=18.58 TRINITY_DN6773_c0_g1_i1:92-535(-)